MKEYSELWKTPQGRNRILAEIALSVVVVLIALLVIFATSGFSAGAQVGAAQVNPHCSACQVFFAYVCPAGGALQVVWLSEPTWPDAFPQHYCAWYDAQAGR